MCPVMPDRLLRVEQARERLQVSRAKLYEFINSGQLQSIMLGPKSRRIVEASLDDLIARRTKESA
jgi:excisionase family DNA binding protein